MSGKNSPWHRDSTSLPIAPVLFRPLAIMFKLHLKKYIFFLNASNGDNKY